MKRYGFYYHPIPFRGHFIRYVLAEAGQEWDEPGHDEVMRLKALPVAEQPVPFMAPPVLHDRDRDLWLPQMPAIVMHLGREHGLSRDADLELRLLCDASDILFEITRWHGAQMWEAKSWAAFTGGRLPRWMRMHERLAGSAEGLADLVLAALWHTMVDRLPGLRALLHDTAPRLEARVDAVAASPRVAAMLETWSGREPRYCAGQIEASLLDMLEKGPEA
ncbi:hypothetical protein [Marimonas arenosa]|uniref:Glutathione S-transferase n=1 Tax=Marimonas arenosa TaxID=1795305 RepID=A0AAE3WI32_9RHOB|nr:hypothetical protein [Marimonas arenosa]MDQ2092222.1 glutathione S-transferase [Marimonas arenosa]